LLDPAPKSLLRLTSSRYQFGTASDPRQLLP